MNSIPPNESQQNPQGSEEPEGLLIFKESILRDLTDICEVIETGRRGANVLLTKGYRLLAMEQTAKAKLRRSANKELIYAHKDIVYVLGRTKNISAYQLTDEDFK